MKDAAHLIRLAAVFAVGFIAFLLIRQALVPAGFGKYGHFRPGALDDIRARPVSFAGRAQCAICHDDRVKELQAGKHAGVGCEACHEAQAKHAQMDDPSSAKPLLPDTKVLCARCHEKNSAKPRGFPQVVTAEHSGGEACKSCHNPHSPKL